MKIAFYGKGGIGKSTVAANVSAALAMEGEKVLLIGCDPKADSTRLLTQKKIPTVLQQLNTSEAALRREDIVFPGQCGVSCLEAGGPQAGSGCAGMGITAMEAELRRLGILEEPWDAVVYDVLGDVVCGGFSVPMRKGFAEKVFVVTSADYMALYAANNILKGIRSFSGPGHNLMGGLILNHCRGAAELEIGQEFARRTNTQIALCLPQCAEIAAADYRRQLVTAAYPDSEASLRIRQFTLKMDTFSSDALPQPMDDETLEEFGQWAGRLKEAHNGGSL